MGSNSRKKLLLALILFSGWAYNIYGQTIPYTVPDKPWNDSLGNHRAVIRTGTAGNAVFVDIPWRRRDKDPETKAILITDAAGNEIPELRLVLIHREHGQLIFRPQSGAGVYYVYYLPYRGKKNNGYFEGDYLKAAPAPDPAWLASVKAATSRSGLPQATVIAIQSRTSFDSFYPMEVVATQEEVAALKMKHPGDLLLFPEDRSRPIRMQDDLPLKWIQSGPSDTFSGIACRNEYYVFQIGLFGAERGARDVKVRYAGASFPLTCFNLEGIDWQGIYFKKKLDVPPGKIQPLWFGVDIPADAVPGWHHFRVQISGTGLSPQTVRVSILIKQQQLADRGDGEAWRGSRLRWLNSRLGIDDSVTYPYTALQVNNQIIRSKSADVRLDKTGFPASIRAGGGEILEAPVSLDMSTEEGPLTTGASKVRFLKKKEGIVEWESNSSSRDIHIRCKGSMESDGYLHYQVRLIFLRAQTLKDIRLLIPVRQEKAAYFMGMGLPGMICPITYSWKWHGPQNAFWIGDTDGGIYCKFRGATYEGPMLNLYHPAPPPTWYNDNKGGFAISRDNDAVTCAAYTGEKIFRAGDTCDLEYSLLITPVKQINTQAQFTNRYYHNAAHPAPTKEDLQSGVKVINIHQGNPIEPYINYPFRSADQIRSFVRTWHQQRLKVKLYYTIRELSNQVSELWALRSLGSEVLADGSGGGYIWLREHLVDHYTPQWFTPIAGFEDCDAAILTSVNSRWYNYYIEGLRWLVRNTGIDGVYLDDVAFDRSMLKRMRKVMDREKPGCLIDLHSNTGFSKGPATQYTEYFPYLNKLWFGESFQYDKMPAANWLVEVSGIPFGLMGDMLQGGGNPWRGMVYGMTVRYPWYTEGVNCDPRAIWKIWDQFGIARSKMIGYWRKDNLITTSDSSVSATVYIKNDRMLIALASWAKDTVQVKLNINWKKIGWKPAGSMMAPAIENYQPAATFKRNESIPVNPTKGWLLIIKAAKQ